MSDFEAKCGGCQLVHAKVALTNGVCDKCRIEAACAQFPDTFRLRGHEGTFRASRRSSYISGRGENTTVMVYTQRLMSVEEYRRHYSKPANPTEEDRWVDFAKGTVGELKSQVVR